jgi:hypothetical protein
VGRIDDIVRRTDGELKERHGQAEPKRPERQRSGDHCDERDDNAVEQRGKRVDEFDNAQRAPSTRCL